ncbi:phage portal protein [Enterococcus olivae]
MELETAIKLFEKLELIRTEIHKKYKVARRYYHNENDITLETKGESKVDNEKEDFLRKADSRVSNNFHQLLVDQKASYVGSVVPVFDTGSEELDKIITDDLGDRFARTLQRLVVDSSNAGTAWLHCWKDMDTGDFKYSIVPPDQIVVIYNNDIEKKILAIRRTYSQIDPETGEPMIYEEYWTEKEATFFKRKGDFTTMEVHNCIPIIDKNLGQEVERVNVFNHGFDEIPFVRFPNNLMHTNDLDKYKGLIDVYDTVYNGFVNDIKDVQQVIVVLTNYGGTDLSEFMSDLREAKAIKMQDSGAGDRSGVSTLQIDIPVEARNSLLEQTRDAIFLQGQGVNPTKLELGNNSGVALKMLYGLLELKASALESEYRVAFNNLIHLILQAHGKDQRNLNITQTWERASVQNWQEKADMVAKLADVTSKETIAKNNPLAEDWQHELELIELGDSYNAGEGE